MASRYQSTLDGRIVELEAEPTDLIDPSKEPRLQLLDAFIEACLAVVPDRPMRGNARAGLLLFFLGAADRLWQRFALDDRRFPAFAEHLLKRHGLGASQAATLAVTLPRVRDDPTAREMLLAGSETVDLWIDGHDRNSVLRLTDLIVHWQRMAGPSAD